jgi:hypothetical protein
LTKLDTYATLTYMETPPPNNEVKGTFGGVLLVMGLGAAAIELISPGHHLSHELIVNGAERVFWASPGLMTAYGGQNWLRGRPYFKGWLE